MDYGVQGKTGIQANPALGREAPHYAKVSAKQAYTIGAISKPTSDCRIYCFPR